MVTNMSDCKIGLHKSDISCHLRNVKWKAINAFSRVNSSSETQGLLAGTMQLIFLGESLLEELKSPWELILTEPVPEVVEFHPADWAEK